MGVDRITTGPLNAAGTDPFDSPGVLVLDQQNSTLEVVGKGGMRGMLQKVILLLQAQTALTAITAAQNLLTCAFPAGALNVANRTLRVRGSVIFGTTATNSATVTIAVKLDGDVARVQLSRADVFPAMEEWKTIVKHWPGQCVVLAEPKPLKDVHTYYLMGKVKIVSALI